MISTMRDHIRFLSVAVFLISFFVGIPFAHSQEDEYDLSTVSIHNSAYTQTGNIFKINFDITNEVMVQPGVRYGVLLRQHTADGQLTVDEHAEAETLTLGPKERLTKHLTYAAPKVLDGSFTLYVVARNSDGFTLATNKVADVTINRTEAVGAQIDITSCYLTRMGDTSATRYALTDVARIQSGDVLTSHCMVENVSDTTLEVVPRATTYRRSLFGETITAPLTDEAPVVLNAGEKREIITTLSTAGDPQTYMVSLAYGYVSNSVTYRYTVEGSSGSLQNVRLDKDSYGAGDTAQISFDWIGSTALSGPQALISFSTKSGSSCGDPMLYPLSGSRHHDITVPITEDCSEPDLSVRLSDSSIGILGEYLYAIDKTPASAQEEVPEVTNQGIFSNTALLLLFGFAVVVFGALTFAFLARRKKESPLVPPSVGPLVFLMAFSFFSFFHAGSAQAISINVNAPQPVATRFVEFQASLNKSSYTPGETITVTGSAELIGQENCADMGAPAGCNNDKSIRLTVGSAEIFNENLLWTPLTDTGTLQAASSPGTHTLTVVARNQAVVQNRTITYTVTTDGPPDPPDGPPDPPDTPPGGTGTGPFSITARPCTIPLGGSVCSIPGSGGAGITISGASASAAIFVRENTGSAAPALYGFNTGSVSANWVRPHLAFDVYEGASQQSGTWVPTGTRLGSVTNVAQCASGSVWNASAIRCVAAPPDQGGAYIGTCRQPSPPGSGSTSQGDAGCPVVSGSDSDGVDFGWSGSNVTALVLHRKTLSFSVSGLQPGAKMCKVFMIHPDGWQVPSPISYAHQFCTYESNYSDIAVSNGVAQISIPNVDPEYKIDAQYYLFFKNPSATNAVKMSVIVTAFGTGGAELPITTNHCSASLGPDIHLYGMHGYGILRLDEAIPLSLNYGSNLAGAQWNVSAVEFNAAPGDSVSFSRTSGQFTADGATTNPNNQFTMTVRGKPRTVGVHLTATTPQPVCSATNFSVFEFANILYANVGQTYACTGTIPANASPWSGSDNTATAPNTPWHFVQSGTFDRCEFKCVTGYMWDTAQSACIATTGGSGGPEAWKWRISSIPDPDFAPPAMCTADMSGIQNNDSCTPAQAGTCDSNGRRYTCFNTTTEYPYFLIGKVVDMAGAPVPNLKIAAGYAGPPPMFDHRTYGTTGADGRYKLEISGMALNGYLRLPNGAPYDLQEPTPGYIYWNGGQIQQDQTAIEGAEKLVPVADMIVRAIQTATASNGKSVIAADQPDLISEALALPLTGLVDAPLTISAKVTNQTTTAAPGGFTNAFSYRWSADGQWSDLAPITKTTGIAAGASSEDIVTLTPPAAGTLWVKHCVDTGNAVAELNENNNCNVDSYAVSVEELTYTIDANND